MHLSSKFIITPAIKAASSAIGFAAGGPLGMHIGGMLGLKVLGIAGSAMVLKLAEKFGEKVLEAEADSYMDELKRNASFGLEQAYCDALRISLRQLPESLKADPESTPWFSNWDRCLATGLPLTLGASIPRHLLPDEIDGRFVVMLELLRAQGELIERNESSAITSTQLNPSSAIPAALLLELQDRLPALLQENFPKLLVTDKYEQAYRQEALNVGNAIRAEIGDVQAIVSSIDQRLAGVREQLSSIEDIVRWLWERARMEGKFHQQIPTEPQNADAVEDQSANTDNIIAENAEISRLVATVEKVQLQAEGSDNSYSIRFASLYAAGAIDDALRLNEEEMARTEEETEHSRLYYDRGLIYELAFDWFAAYMAFQRAWDGEKNPDYGLRFALFAVRQYKFSEAIAVYEMLRQAHKDPNDQALLLDAIAHAHFGARENHAAEDAYRQVLKIRYEQSKWNWYNAELANAQAELAVFLSETSSSQREEEERLYRASLLIYRGLVEEGRPYMSHVARTLNNLARLLGNTSRHDEAEQIYKESLAIFRCAAQRKPEFLADVAVSLNNLATLLMDAGRVEDAKARSSEARTLLEPMWTQRPRFFGDTMARILWSETRIADLKGLPSSECCALAHKALKAAFYPPLRKNIQRVVDQYCTLVAIV